MNDKRPWSKEEIQLIKKSGEHGDLGKIAQELGRTLNAVYLKRHQIRLDKIYAGAVEGVDESDGRTRDSVEMLKRRTQWSQLEINRLKNMMKAKIPYTNIARRLGRSERAVAIKANKLGLRLADPKDESWTKAQNLELQEIVNRIEDLAAESGRSFGACMHKIRAEYHKRK